MCIQSLVNEGVEVDSSPSTFALQSRGTVQIQLQMTPLQSGKLSFSGTVIFVFSFYVFIMSANNYTIYNLGLCC